MKKLKLRNWKCLGPKLNSIRLCQREGTENFTDEEILVEEIVSRENEGQILKKE